MLFCALRSRTSADMFENEIASPLRAPVSRQWMGMGACLLRSNSPPPSPSLVLNHLGSAFYQRVNTATGILKRVERGFDALSVAPAGTCRFLQLPSPFVIVLRCCCTAALIRHMTPPGPSQRLHRGREPCQFPYKPSSTFPLLLSHDASLPSFPFPFFSLASPFLANSLVSCSYYSSACHSPPPTSPS